jgi:hypothetical protein
MMGKPRKMVSLSIEETSGVDHPAHLHEGWIVVKAADQAEVDAVITALADETTDDGGAMQEEMQTRLDEAAEALTKAQEQIADLETRLAKAETDDQGETPTEDDVLKSAPESVVKMVEALRAETASAVAKADEAQALLQTERDAKADEEAITKAREWSNLSIDPTVVGPALRRIAGDHADLAKAIEDALTAANAQAESGAIFAEIGKAAPLTEGGTTVSRLHTLAKAAVDNGQAATVEQAFADLASANPSLYAEYLTEKGA